MDKPRIQLAFSDFWPEFDPADNYFTRLLCARYQIVLSDDPDFLIYSRFGRRHRRYRCVKIYFTGETDRPDFRVCDFAFSFEHWDRPEHYRLPLYAIRFCPTLLLKRSFDPESVLREKTRFCGFVASNPKCPKRNRFFRKLSRYKRVDSGGRFLNNVGGPVKDKLEFVRRCKFTIAFENCSRPGYTTEKIVEPMVVGSLPIYWGNPLVHLDFNPRSFLNYHDYGDDEALIERIVEADRNDDLYFEYLAQPWFVDNRLPELCRAENVLAQFDRIFRTQKRPAARSPWYALYCARQRAVRHTVEIVRNVRAALGVE